MQPNLQINPQRLWDDLMETARIGGTPKGGVRRLALSDEDRRVRDWLRAQCEALGCVVGVDEVGAMFARRHGADNTLAPIAIGSHLDTQPTGGKFDGVLGVLAGLEVLRTLRDLNYTTHAPLELVNWTNEEGARFAPAMLASGVFAGVFTPDFALSRADRDGAARGGEHMHGISRRAARMRAHLGNIRLHAFRRRHARPCSLKRILITRQTSMKHRPGQIGHKRWPSAPRRGPIEL